VVEVTIHEDKNGNVSTSVSDDGVGIDKDIRDLLSDALATEGYVVASARHGAEALERLRAFRPDLILLDLMMPVMSGWQVMDALRISPTLSSIPVIVISAAHQLPAGVCVVTKPFRFEELLRKMRTVLGEA